MLDRMNFTEVVAFLGCCKRDLLAHYVRLGLLPYPGDDFMWARKDVLAAVGAREN